MDNSHNDCWHNRPWFYFVLLGLIGAILVSFKIDWGESGVFGWIENHPGLAAWIQAIGTVGAIIAAVGIAAKQHKRSERMFRTADVAGRNLMPVLVRLAELRKEGVTMRGALSEKNTLMKQDVDQLSWWEHNVIDEMKKISPAQAEAFATLDLVPVVNLPFLIAQHRELVHHTERLKRLKDFIDRFDPAITGDF